MADQSISGRPSSVGPRSSAPTYGGDRPYGEEGANRPHSGSAQGRRIWPTGREWLLFVAQALLVVMIELGDDILRGNLVRPNATEALAHARQVVHFETSHGLFLEPAIQAFFDHSHHLLGLLLTWSEVVALANNVYAFCHIFVTLGVALWLYIEHRPRFVLVRNITLLTNLLALLGYELYPMAPPRLTTGLTYGGHAFQFQDPMRHILGSGTLNGTPLGYNPLSAMPSLHVAWALIMGAAVLLVARHPLLRLAGGLYPLLMTWVVVVTANHYLMDAIGAALAVSIATALTLTYRFLRIHLPRGARSERTVAKAL